MQYPPPLSLTLFHSSSFIWPPAVYLSKYPLSSTFPSLCQISTFTRFSTQDQLNIEVSYSISSHIQIFSNLKDHSPFLQNFNHELKINLLFPFLHLWLSRFFSLMLQRPFENVSISNFFSLPAVSYTNICTDLFIVTVPSLCAFNMLRVTEHCTRDLRMRKTQVLT